ncbi:MAG TPA: hypothetical protein VH228_18505 [Nocardioides sp.]|jgi:hypothetical protein|nr:hypothetical protein [Nocardioides sp.]
MPRDRDDHDLHSQIFELILSKVRDDAYPSTTHLDMIEEMLRDEDEVEEYSSALIDKVRLDTYPSIDHLRRLMNFA